MSHPSSKGRWFRSAVATLAILSTVSAACLPLKGTTVCPGFDAYSVDSADIAALVNYGITLPAFTDIKSFDQAVLNATAFTGGSDVCSSYNSTVRVRYQNSLVCAVLVHNNAGRKCNTANYPRQLCQSSCQAYQQSFTDMAKTTCASDTTTTETANSIAQICAGNGWESLRSTDTATCIDAVKTEALTCGYGDTQHKCDFCKKNGTDPCCSDQATVCSQNTPSATTAGTSPASTAINIPPTSTPGSTDGSNGSNKSDTGLSTAAIGGIAGGGVGLVLLIALTFFCMRRSRRAAPTKSNLSRNLSNASGKYSISAPKLQEEGFANIQIPMSTLPPISQESTASAAAVGAAAGSAVGAGAAAAGASAAGATDTNSKPSFCQAIYPYQASMADELDLSPGDIINVHRVFDDGWAVGTNLNTSAEGAFPIVCVTAVDENALDDDFEEVNMANMTPMTLREEDQGGRHSPSGRNSPRSSLPSRPASPVHLPRRNSSIRDSAVIPTGTSPLTSSPLAGGSSGGKLTPPVRDTMMSEASSINRWWDGEGSKQ